MRHVPSCCLHRVVPWRTRGGATLSFGVAGGASLTGDFRNFYQPIPETPLILGYESEPERYIVGGMLELQLPRDWSIEADALYHPLRYDSVTISPHGASANGSPSPVVTFEFPMLAKYRFRWGSWRPFLEGGPSLRTAGNLNGTHPSHYGIAAGVGAETGLGRFRISPEVRYIRWAHDPEFGSPFTRSSQIELLTSFSTGGFEGGQAFSRRVSLGALVGATLTPDFRSVTFPPSPGLPAPFSYSSNSGAFLLGAAVEVAVARGFSFEGDAFHQSLRDTSRLGGYPAYTETWNTWNFPLLGKYKFSTHGMKPFLEAGPEFRDAPQPQGISPYGVTAGVGIEKRVWRLDVAPAVRYTHWGRFAPNFQGALQPFQNQVTLLAGFSL